MCGCKHRHSTAAWNRARVRIGRKHRFTVRIELYHTQIHMASQPWPAFPEDIPIEQYLASGHIIQRPSLFVERIGIESVMDLLIGRGRSICGVQSYCRSRSRAPRLYGPSARLRAHDGDTSHHYCPLRHLYPLPRRPRSSSTLSVSLSPASGSTGSS
jgi:hypothetical protein